MFKHKPDTRHDSYHICPITSYYILWQLYIIYIIISFSHFYFIFQFLRAVISALASLSCSQLSVNYCCAVLAYCGKQID